MLLNFRCSIRLSSSLLQSTQTKRFRTICIPTCKQTVNHNWFQGWSLSTTWNVNKSNMIFWAIFFVSGHDWCLMWSRCNSSSICLFDYLESLRLSASGTHCLLRWSYYWSHWCLMLLRKTTDPSIDFKR